MKKEHLKDFNIQKDFKNKIICKKCGENIIELLAMSHRNNTATIQKLNKDYMLVLSSGEIISINHKENRSESKAEVSHSTKRLRDYINTNVTDVSKCKWVTLTYAENMTDTKRLYKDIEKFIKRFRYSYKDYKIEYIIAVEPQARGAWHCHCIFIFDKKCPYIPNQKIQELWGQGFTKTQKLSDIDNIGAYLSSYLGDIEYTEENLQECLKNGLNKLIYKEINSNGDKKKFIKGGRLYLYPSHFNLYRVSRGIKKPIIYNDYYNNIKRKEGLGKPSFTTTIQLTTENFSNIICYEHYNKKRK